MRIDVNSVSKRFDRFTAVENVTISVAEGSLTALLGPSGSGKSTLLRIVAGLEVPDEGTIAIDGNDVTQARPQDRGIGFVFQHYAAFTHMTVWQNVAFGLIQGRGMAQQKARDIALQKLAAVGLGPEVALLRPAELSGGMQKRVALARAIAADPEIVFFDEPTTGLDPIMADVINRLIVDSVRGLGATTISITHDMTSARRIADRIAMLHKGRIIWQGPVAEIDQTDNPYVDQFVHGRAEGPIQMEVRAA